MSNSNAVPGFRFYPTEEELLLFYLHNKLEKKREANMDRVIPVTNVYFFDPWQLPQISGEACIQDSEHWFFFCPRQEREAHGGRPARTTPSGYWKATGSPSNIYAANRRIGMKKTMVFYKGKAPSGTKTKWKMNEYKAYQDDSTLMPGEHTKLRNEFSLCRVYDKPGCLRSFDRRPPPEKATPETNGNVSGTKRGRSNDHSSSSDGNGGNIDRKVFEEIEWALFDDED